MRMSLRTTIAGLASLLAVATLTPPVPAAAAPRYSGTVTGVFDTPVLTGAYLDVGSRQPVVCDNTTVAPGFGAATSNFTWGDTHGGSVMEFVGESFSDVAPGEVFPLGTVTFFNGWNRPNALVFGFSVQLSAGDGIAPFVGPVEVVSTLNGNSDRMADADVLVLDAFETPSTLAAFEGTAVKAIVYGRIGDDAELEVTSMSLAPGEVNGCVSEAPLQDTAPCASACGGVCAAARLAIGGSLCGDEQLPSGLQVRIDQAVRLLGRARDTDSERKAKKGVHRAMKQLQRSASIAGGAAKKGSISPECAEAISRAIGNARSQADAWLAAR